MITATAELSRSYEVLQFSVFQSSAACDSIREAGVDLGTVFRAARLVNPEPAAEGKVPFANGRIRA